MKEGGEAESKSKGGSHVHRCVPIQVPKPQPARVSKHKSFDSVESWIGPFDTEYSGASFILLINEQWNAQDDMELS